MSARAIARSCSLSPSTVSGYLGRVKVAKLSTASAHLAPARGPPQSAGY
nr:hypothetical protein [Hyalangium versicolor]